MDLQDDLVKLEILEKKDIPDQSDPRENRVNRDQLGLLGKQVSLEYRAHLEKEARGVYQDILVPKAQQDQ